MTADSFAQDGEVFVVLGAAFFIEFLIHDGKKGQVTIRVVVGAGAAGAEDDVFGFREMAQEGAGGDDQDGFAESHFIGEEGALSEREVERQSPAGGTGMEWG